MQSCAFRFLVCRLSTPPMTSVFNACIEFYYHMYGEDINELAVSVVSQDNNVRKLWYSQGAQSDMWTQLKVDALVVPGDQVLVQNNICC